MTNFGEHLLRRVIDEHFYDLLVRPRVLMGKHVPGIGLNQVRTDTPCRNCHRWSGDLQAVAMECRLSLARCAQVLGHGFSTAGTGRRRLRSGAGPLAREARRRGASAARI